MKKNAVSIFILVLAMSFCGFAANPPKPTAAPSSGQEGLDLPTVTPASWKPTSSNVLGIIYESSTQGLKKIWEAFSFQEIKDAYKRDYVIQILGKKAEVEKGVMLTSEGYLHPTQTKEGQFITKRIPKAKVVLENFTGLKFRSNDEVPRIGCAFSGGGYRAMIATSGFLKALEDIGVLDGVLNISTLSGSVWCVGPWTFCQRLDQKVTIKQYQATLLEKINSGKFNLLPKDAKNINFDTKSFIEKVIEPKIIFDQIVSSIDIYGGMLAYTLLNNSYIQGDKPFAMRLSGQWENIKNGDSPWPSYTTVSMHNVAPKGQKDQYKYNWYELNPEEMRNLDQNIGIQAYAFGRKFENGFSVDSVNFAPEQSFGYLMGICGSAYTVNFKDLSRIMFGYEPSPTGNRKKDLTNAAYVMVTGLFGADTIKKAGATLKDIFSYAKNGNFSGIKDILVDKSGNLKKSALDPIMGIIFGWLLDTIADVKIEKTIKIKSWELGKISTTVGTLRVSPAQIANPFKGYTGIDQPWLTNSDYLTLVDAGIDYNIPLRPLLRPERSLDLIIIGDASDEADAGSLELALQDAKRVYGLTYTKDEKVSGKTVRLYRCDQKTYPNLSTEIIPPDIIYFNFFKDDKKISQAKKRNDSFLTNVITDNALETFKPEDCLKNFCSTFNFDYTQQQFQQLSGMAEFNVKDNRDLIESMILYRAELRQGEPPEFGM